VTQRLVPDPDLDALIRKLNEAARTGPPAVEESTTPELPEPAALRPLPPAPSMREVHAPRPPLGGPSRWRLPDANPDAEQWLASLLEHARASHASDLLLVPGTPPMERINGKLHPAGEAALNGNATSLLCAALTPRERRESLEVQGATDFSLTRAGVGRLRCNVHRERDVWAAAIRLLPESVSDLESLHLPASLNRFAELEYGLVLVTGPTGSGKSTTLAALTKRILARRRVHVLTIEDPVEYEHPHGNSAVEHIEIGRDATSFAWALRAALRQAPDVLLIGEMRDSESISIAITAAETGHLVLSTLHTGDAPQTVNRIIDSYPANQMETVRVQLSVSLAGIISQQLLPRKDGQGRVPAVEVLMATPAVRNLIRQGKIQHMRSQIALERSAGMLSIDRSLARLVLNGLVDVSEARPRARTPEEFDQLLRREDGV
jgi:twitching motility protein PilT